MKVNELFIVEAKKAQTQTRAQTRVQDQDDPFLRAFGQQFDRTVNEPKQVPAAATAPAPAPRQPARQAQTSLLRQAGGEVTRQRMANVELPAGAEEKMAAIADLDLDDEAPDEEIEQRAATPTEQRPALPQPTGTDVKVPSTALATINTAIAKAGEVEPEWHQVRHLPGYLQRPIRAMGRQVFGQMTSTPIENIQVLADLGNSGNPNSARELNAVAGWLKTHGERDTDGEIKFQRVIPDYEAKFFIYRAKGTTFMLVKDFAGQYIYSWPSTDEESAKRSKERIVPQLPRR